MKSLSELSLNKTAVEELPSSIECLTALTSLNLGDCQNLECLPSNMDSLRSLEKLLLPGCLKLSALPENVWKMKCLKKLDLSGPGIRRVSQNKLNLGGMFRLQRIGLNSIGFLCSLKYLTLSGNSLVTLPASISQLSKLEALDLSNCFKLQSLPELPSTVRYINAEGCYSLKPLPALRKPSPDPLKLIQSFGFKRHYYNESNGGVAFKILNRYLQGVLHSKTGYETPTEKKKEGSRTEFQIIIPAMEIPRWFTHQRVGNSISIDLPPNWCNSRWMGFALCAKLEGYNYLSGLNSNKTFDFRARVMALGGSLHSQLNSEIVFKVAFGAGDIWILYLSRDDWFATFPNGEYNQIKVVFESCGSTEKVHKCGVSLVYEQSVEGFYQTSTQRSRNSIIAYEGWDGVLHDEMKLSEFQSFKKELEKFREINRFVSSFSVNDDYNDPGPSASRSLLSD
ncbi:disease resistance protein RPS4B-like isoform X2 [Quercus robur]|uniref:disease resistance protein RPS4B-like isoform X2 n=1 Tax=Quercus robur TaxID=38942 RepID=UPI002161918B|nr:disease resistance protein RPS4B-like isoform X2 [Quercus robur]